MVGWEVMRRSRILTRCPSVSQIQADPLKGRRLRAHPFRLQQSGFIAAAGFTVCPSPVFVDFDCFSPNEIGARLSGPISS